MPQSIEQAVQDASRWADMPGVEAVAQSERNGEPCILVLVSSAEAGDTLPKEFNGYAVVVEQSGRIAIERD
jgi:hypothetical protein